MNCKFRGTYICSRTSFLPACPLQFLKKHNSAWYGTHIQHGTSCTSDQFKEAKETRGLVFQWPKPLWPACVSILHLESKLRLLFSGSMSKCVPCLSSLQWASRHEIHISMSTWLASAQPLSSAFSMLSINILYEAEYSASTTSHNWLSFISIPCWWSDFRYPWCFPSVAPPERWTRLEICCKIKPKSNWRNCLTVSWLWSAYERFSNASITV